MSARYRLHIGHNMGISARLGAGRSSVEEGISARLGAGRSSVEEAVK